MDTNKLKKFATEARNILKQGVANKMLRLGFDGSANIEEIEKPVLIQGGAIFNGQQQSEAFYYQWMSLYSRIKDKGIREVYEEAAYTWFNRLMAIRILQKNGLAEPVLDFVDVARTPQIVDAARMGHHPQMSAADEEKLRDLISDTTAVVPQFSLLITAYCHNNPIINKCFGSIADYTELLLPEDILSENGFLDKLNQTEFISDEDFASPELIGWLYQFYISERKDEVFAKKGKFEADEIPAATQIFTPNWIVKYMVQNTIGRIYLDNNPWATELKEKWKYLVEPSDPTPDEAKLKYSDLTELRVGDLACGSGHILNECFDILFDLYIEDGYSRSEAIEAIFEKNLTGIDLDTRAKQLATFALLLKACQRDKSFADAHCMPNVLDMPKPQKDEVILKNKLHKFFKGNESRQDMESLLDAFKLMRDADSLGSIMIFDIPDSTRSNIKQAVEYYKNNPSLAKEFDEILSAIKLILALTEKFHALVMNPPYLESGNMNSVLSKYINTKYKIGKNDLYTVFMLISINHLYKNGKFGMINMDTWTYKSSFIGIREYVLEETNIDSMLSLGARTFEELNGEVVQNVTFCITNMKTHLVGAYLNLSSGKTSSAKHHLFNSSKDELFYILQNSFEYTPGKAIGVISEKVLSIFSILKVLSDVGESKQGLATGNNPRFTRFWPEVSFNKIGFTITNTSESVKSGKKWFPYNKGGNRRMWYGNQELIVNWEKNGEEIKHFTDENGNLRSRPQNTDYYFKQSISWGLISGPYFRYFPNGFIYDIQGMSYFINQNVSLYNILAWLNSNVFRYLGKSINPREQYQAGDLLKLPYSENKLGEYSKKNIEITKSDWDAHETSWDFKMNELVRLTQKEYIDIYSEYTTYIDVDIDLAAAELGSLEWRLDVYKTKWNTKFNQLHDNEEELNRQFIEIYGLQDELTPDVPLNEITILQQGEISIENNEFVWHDDVIIKQLISYAVGCWMGRYRLDKPGLHIAHPNPTDEEVCTYKYNESQLTIDDDGIIPILPAGCAFDDNLVKRVQEFIRIAFGAETVNQNMNFVEECLSMSLEKYLQKDFWKDHKKMYQNRPIYWLFSSKKGAFQCLVYMHRMDANTADKVRSNYLMKHMDWLRQSIAGYESNIVALNTTERNKLKKLHNDLAECEEYNDRLQLIADKRIAFDLDDGVIVNYAKFGDVLQKIK